MPYLICSACRTETYSAAGYATTDRCPRCDASLGGAERADRLLNRWKVSDLRLDARRAEALDGLR
jgi:hypothetical protein